MIFRYSIFVSASMSHLAPYASHAEQSRGRLKPEPESAMRSVFQRDRDRIIHCTAFRRLKHKTQVFIAHTGDYYRTRLTHSMEVAQLARSMAHHLQLNEALTEALALGHDLGHPPFGHAGEDALNEVMNDQDGGFDHNAQSLRIVTALEERYAEFDGLNLSWECLEGIAKHNGPRRANAKLPYALAAYAKEQDLALASWPGPEAQLAALADDIAYNNHDLDDGLRLGLLAFEPLEEVPVVGDALREVKKKYGKLAPARQRHEMIRRVIDAMVRDVLAETKRRIAQHKVAHVQDVYALKGALVGFSAEMARHNDRIKAFLYDHMYRHHLVVASMSKARRLIARLFALYCDEPALLPPTWQQKCEPANRSQIARTVCDYVAGMTDRFASAEYQRHFDLAGGLNETLPMLP